MYSVPRQALFEQFSLGPVVNMVAGRNSPKSSKGQQLFCIWRFLISPFIVFFRNIKPYSTQPELNNQQKKDEHASCQDEPQSKGEKITYEGEERQPLPTFRLFFNPKKKRKETRIERNTKEDKFS